MPYRCATLAPRSRARLLGCFIALLFACGETDRLAEVRELQRGGDYQASLEILRDLAAERPHDAEINYLTGIALIRTQSPALAVWSLQEAARHPDWAVPAGIALAGSALRAREHSLALEAADRVLEIEPDNVGALYLRAEARLGTSRDFDAALADLDRLLELQPDSLPGRVSRVAVLLLAERVEEAEAAIDDLEAQARAAEADVASLARVCALRAVFESEAGDLEKADASFESCLENFPAYPALVQEAAAYFDRRGRPERANEALRNALAEAPEAQPFRTALAGRLRAAGDAAAAEATLREGTAAEHVGTKAAAWKALVDHFVALDQLDAAVEAYAQLLELLPNAPVAARLEYADLLGRAGQHERALEVAGEFENEAYRHLVEARVHYNEHRPARALEHLDALLVSWPNNPGARYYAARCAEQLGDFDRAVEEYRQSLRSGAAVTEAGSRLARLHFAQGQRAGGWTALYHHMKAHPEDGEAVAFAARQAVQEASPDSPPPRLKGLVAQVRGTPAWPHLLAALADIAGARQGPEAAMASIRSAQGMDLTSPRNAKLLQSLVEQLSAAGQHQEARAAADAALQAHENHATFHAIRGVALELGAGPPEAARASYERAVELDAREALALKGLARLAVERGDAQEALAFFDRAAAAHPTDPRSGRHAARLASELGDPSGAERRWQDLLREHPWDPAAAIALARLRLARDAETETTLALAQQAVRFRGGSEAGRLLARVHEVRGEPDRAAEILKRIEAREAQLERPEASPPG